MALPNSKTVSEPPTFCSDDGKEEYAKMNWDELGFDGIATDFMYIMKWSKEEHFMHGGRLIPFGNIELSPYAGVLNFGQGVFEGLKAYRREDGDIQLFRPDQNALRLKTGAERLCLPSPSVDQFIDGVKQTVLANKRWVPPVGKGSLYLRPLLIGSGPTLGPAPAPECTFLIYATPVGNYHKGRVGLNLLVEDKRHRAIPGGTGDIKSITNYAPVYQAQIQARAKGFSDVLFLDSTTGKFVEEVGACNIFIVKGNVVSTPELKGTILPGVTRKSILEIAATFGYEVEERQIAIEDLVEAEEAFCTGTAVIVNPIATITYHGKRVEYKTGVEALSHKLYNQIAGIQAGLVEDHMGWTLKVN